MGVSFFSSTTRKSFYTFSRFTFVSGGDTFVSSSDPEENGRPNQKPSHLKVETHRPFTCRGFGFIFSFYVFRTPNLCLLILVFLFFSFSSDLMSHSVFYSNSSCGSVVY